MEWKVRRHVPGIIEGEMESHDLLPPWHFCPLLQLERDSFDCFDFINLATTQLDVQTISYIVSHLGRTSHGRNEGVSEDLENLVRLVWTTTSLIKIDCEAYPQGNID